MSRQTSQVIQENHPTDGHPYRMTISLNVLNHLGLGLYSNVPAVLAEAVANAWDADAESVDVEIDADGEKIVITDDGHGMTRSDVNERFLNVGYARRNDPGGSITPKFARQVMGRKGIGKNALEKVIQEHLYNHLWLLDPSWERATETYMEETVAKAFADIDAKLDPEEKKGRLDIRYCRTSGVHVIVELKRAERVVSRTEIDAQVTKYKNALRKVLEQAGRGDEPIDVVVLVGRPLKEWTTPAERQETRRC